MFTAVYYRSAICLFLIAKHRVAVILQESRVWLFIQSFMEESTDIYKPPLVADSMYENRKCKSTI